MSDLVPPKVAQPIDSLKLFNEFQAQSRARSEATLKLVVAVSGAMLTLTVGAVLGSTPAKIPSHLLPILQWGWGLLFWSIAGSMLLLCSMIVATFHMGVRWRKALTYPTTSFAFIATWSWLRVANAVLALSILCSFLAGIGLLATVAIGVASAMGTSAAVAPGPSPATNPSIERAASIR